MNKIYKYKNEGQLIYTAEYSLWCECEKSNLSENMYYYSLTGYHIFLIEKESIPYSICRMDELIK